MYNIENYAKTEMEMPKKNHMDACHICVLGSLQSHKQILNYLIPNCFPRILNHNSISSCRWHAISKAVRV